MERVMGQLATSFSERENLNIDLVLIGRKREIVYTIPSSVNIHRPPFQFDNSTRKVSTLRTIWFLRKKVKNIHPNVVLSFGEYWNNLVLLSLYGLSYPVYISDRSEPDKNLGKVQNFLRNTLYPNAAGYIAQTEEAKSVCLENSWNENVRVIGNPIRKIYSNGEERENIVLSVGRLIKTKHFDRLIKLFIKRRHPGWKLMIVGGDAKREKLSQELKSLIQELDAENIVFLEGEQKDIESYYRKSKLFAFTSSSEGFPNVIGEALSSGIPVISYNCVAGPSEMIENGRNGFLVPVFDDDQFQEKMFNLMKNEDLRRCLGKGAKESVKKFDTSNIAKKYLKFIIS